MKKKKVAIIGAGISGLTAALYLKRANIPFEVFEKTAEVGGRMKSELVEGLIVDHGFQIFLTSYPEALSVVNYADLEFTPLTKGFTLCKNKKKYFLEYPNGRYRNVFNMLRYPFMDIKSLWNMAKIVVYLRSTSLKKIFSQKDIPTHKFLKNRGLSDDFISHTLQPFLKGIFLENNLETSSKVFQYVLKMMLSGSIVVPTNGMGAIPKQLYKNIGTNYFHFFKSLEKIENENLFFEDGYKTSADFIIDTRPKTFQKKAHQNSLFVFMTPNKVLKACELAVFENNPLGISNLVQFSNLYVNSRDVEYIGISVNNKVSESNKLDSKKILEYITNYFDTTDWKWIKTHHIPYGLNNQEQVNYSYKKEIMAQKEKTYLAGDWNLYGSTNAAIHSGKCAAEAIIRRVNTNI